MAEEVLHMRSAGGIGWGLIAAMVTGCQQGPPMTTGSAQEPIQPPAETPRRANRLIREKSPYLLQHAHNPVDWYPWGDEAMAKARREDKPIFLSIGYSTCHWCHVMERESFEDPEIARLLNDSFVSIKVDREEHPDLDQVYMQAVMLLAGQGGWPLTVFLTPDLKPFFGGTYFPPDQQGGRPGMKEILPAVAEAWTQKREEIRASSEQLTTTLSDQLAQTATPGPLTLDLLHAAFNHAAATFDPAAGGFGDAPKFPRAHELSFLLRYWARTGTAQALEMVTVTLDHLARGGIHDQVGGGFHRYSTDARWLIPHFEKMLYDQALLARAYLEAYRITNRAEYAAVARDTYDYVLRDLTGPHGGFFSAEDADSEGEEGKFYVWTPEEVIRVLGEEDGGLVNRFYGVTPEGNFEHRRSILHIEQPLEAFAKLKGLDTAALAERLASARAKLLAARSARIRPHRDDKILTSWNGLMIAAFAYGGATLQEPRYVDAARRAAEFILTSLAPHGGLLRRYRDGDARYAGTLEDYAFFIDGLIELYEADFDPRWLAEAKRLAAQMTARFWDDAAGGFFMRGKDETPLIVRSKELYDGATPSGNSMAVHALLRLGRLTGDRDVEAVGRRTLEGIAAALERTPAAYPQMMSEVEFALGPTTEVVIAGNPDAAETAQMVRMLHSRFLPRAVTLLHAEGGSGRALEALAPYVKAQGMLHGKATAYLCENFVCALPTTDPAMLAERLDHPGQGREGGGPVRQVR